MGTVPQEATRVQYLADGIADVFIYPFFIPLEIDLAVWVTPAGSPPNETVDRKILNTNYTVQDAGVPGGGTITFLPGFIPGAGDQVTISRVVEDSITTNYVDARTINGANLDESFEREMLVTQQNVTNLDLTALRYQNNSFLPDVLNRNIIPTLDPNFIWKGSASGNVIAVEDKEEGGCSSLRSELASEAQGSDGAGLVGYFDENRLLSTTVRDQLNEYGDPATGQDGARLIGYYDPVNAVETNVGDQLDIAAGFPEKLQNGFAVYGDDVGAADALEVNVTPAYQSYVAGTKVFVKVANNNATRSPTLDLNALGAVNIVNNDGTQLFTNDLRQDGIYEFIYDGVNFQLMNNLPKSLSIFSQIDEKIIVNTAAEVSIFGTLAGSKEFLPNEWVRGSAYSYLFKTQARVETALKEITIRFRINGVQISSIVLTHVNGVDFHNFDLIFQLFVKEVGIAGVAKIDLYTQTIRYDSQIDIKYPEVIENYIVDSTNIDTTVANDIDVTVQYQQGDIANEFRSIAATVQRLF